MKKRNMKKYLLNLIGISLLFIGVGLIFRNIKITGAIISGTNFLSFEYLGAIFLISGISILLLNSYSGRGSLENRMSKSITGRSYRDPSMASRLARDQAILRQKYSIPSRDMLFEEPLEYERRLIALANKNGIKIEKREGGLPGGVAALYDEDSDRVIIDTLEKNPNNSYRTKKPKSITRYLSELTHEVVHGLQDKKYPSMPLELKEYESYLLTGTGDPEKLKSLRVRKGLFGLIVGSTNWAKSRDKADK